MLQIALSLLAVQVVYLVILRAGWVRAVSSPTIRSAGVETPSEEETRSSEEETRLSEEETRSSREASRPSGSEVPANAGRLSVIVAARDEAEHIPILLAALRRQTYPHFEAIVVDDGSVDETADAVRRVAADDPRFRLVVNPDPRSPRKKHALTVGIAASVHPRLVFTDADCDPPAGWLAGLAKGFGRIDDSSAATVLVGHGMPAERPGTLNRLQRWDANLAAFTAAAAIGWNRPYLAKGSNLAYDRSVFEAVGGFSEGLTAMSGDDDLFVQSVARAGCARIRYVADPETYVPSPSPDTWSAWFRQKIRHTSAARGYGRVVQVHLAAYHGSAVLLWLAPLAAGLPGAAVLAARLMLLAVTAEGPMRRLGGGDLIAATPVLDLLHALFHAVIPPIGFFVGPRRW